MDVIETLLQTTGLSCDDLLMKLQQYRQNKDSPSNKENDLSTDQSTCSTSNRLAQAENSNSVILAKDQCIVNSTTDEKCVENVDKVESDDVDWVVEDEQTVENLEKDINLTEQKDSRVSSSQFDVEILETTVIIVEDPKSNESSSISSAENIKKDELETVILDENSMVLPSHSDESKCQDLQCVENSEEINRAEKDSKLSSFHFDKTQINIEVTKKENNSESDQKASNSIVVQKDSRVSYHSDEIQIDLEDSKPIDKPQDEEQDVKVTLVCFNDIEPVEILEKKFVSPNQESTGVCSLQIDEISTLMKDTESTSNLDIHKVLDSSNNVEKVATPNVNSVNKQFNFQEAEIFLVSKEVEVRDANIEDTLQNVEPEEAVSPKAPLIQRTLDVLAVDENISSEKEIQCADIELNLIKIHNKKEENHIHKNDHSICSKEIFESCNDSLDVSTTSTENTSSIVETLTERKSEDKEKPISDQVYTVNSAIEVDQTKENIVEAKAKCAMEPANDFDESSCSSEQNSLISDLLAKFKKNEDQEKKLDSNVKKDKITLDLHKLPENSAEKSSKKDEAEVKENLPLPLETRITITTLDGKDDSSRQSSSLWDSQEESNADSVEDNDSTYTPHSEENLRDILKRQLFSLRNKKKTNLCLPDLKNRTRLFHNIKKKRKSCDLNAAIRSSLDTDEEDKLGKNCEESCKDETQQREPEKVEVNATEERDDTKTEVKDDTKDGYHEDIKIENNEVLKNDEKEWSVNEDTLVSLSEETNFVILDVTGGVDRLSPTLDNKENDPKLDSPKDDSESKDLIKFEETDIPKLEESEGEHKLPRVTINKSISENFNHDPGIKTAIKNNEKSPFVSDSLDEFLSESSKLEISYDIPKLNAEEGIKESTIERLFEDPVKKPEPISPDVPTKDKDKPKLVKAKTLADMRRQFEKLKSKEEKNVLEDERPRRKRKLKGFYGVDENTETVEDAENTKPYFTLRNSYVIYENKVLRVPSKGKPKCVSVINSDISKEVIYERPKSKNICVTNKKLTLLSCLNQNKRNKVSYKAGPLCKKMILQNVESKDNWCTEVKTLPKIYLEVIPEYRKKINPKFRHLLPIFDDPIISKERVDFALTALEPKNFTPVNKLFTFRIPYKNNQEHMLVRKYVEKKVLAETVLEENEPETVIAKVLNDLITYVEVKELAPTLLKEDDVVFDLTETNIIKKSRPKKRKKLDYELKRLSCKVIDLGTDEPDANCPKPYCKFGCVCKSLLCQSVFSNHCQLVECMFECKCRPGESTNLPSLSHLEDQAKKDLAKVEKEFTQTIIHTDDNAILMGRVKSKRSSKLPKKYSDYVSEEIQPVNTPNLATQEFDEVKPFKLMLEKLQLEDLIPLCMVHNEYNCNCNSKAQPEAKRKIIKLNQEIQTAASSSSPPSLPNCARLREVYSTYKERNKTEKYKKIIKSNIVGNDDVLYARISHCESKFTKKRASDSNLQIQETIDKKHRRKQSFDVREDVALQNFALQRRKKQPIRTIKYNPVFDGEIRVPLKENKDMLRFLGKQKISVLSEYLRILPWRKLVECYRAKTLNIWCDKDGTKLLCNRKGYFPPKHFMDIKDCSNRSEIIEWILTDRLPTKCPRDLMHLILTPKSIHFQISGYCLKKSAYAIDSPTQSKSLSIIDVEKVDSSESNLVYESNALTIEKIPTRRHFISINKLFDEKEQNPRSRKVLKIRPQLEVTVSEPTQKPKPTDVKKIVCMKSILNHDKPSELFATPIKENETIILDTSDYVTPEEEVEVTVGKKRRNKDPLDITIQDSSKVKRKNLAIQGPSHRKVGKPLTFQQSLLKSENDFVDPAATKTLRCTHKDMNNENKILAVFNYTFPQQKFTVEDKLDTFECEVTAALPVIGKNHRWRMIHLNSDFAFLLFTKSKYSIKYTDLMDVVNMASNVKATIALRNKEFKCNFKHPLFGIFCVSTFTDRLFVGPYERTEDHGLETLRYLQGKLIDTEIFNTMIGRQIKRKYPSWIIPASLSTSQVIDVTGDKVVEVIDIDSDSGEEEESDVFQDCLFCSPFVEEVKKDEGGYTINRYIMTNIPYLGYFNGYQQHDKKTIDVYWPTGNRIFRFPNVTLAKHLLTLYLSHIFCPIPSNFKINVVIMTNLDLLQSTTAVDGKYFSNKSFYFCGDFGILGKNKLTSSILKKHNIKSKESILQGFKQRKEDHEAITKIFGCFLMSNEELRTHSTWETILKWAISEIYILTKLSDYYDSENRELKTLIRKNTDILCKKRVEKLKKKNKVIVSETIEITDSEDEEPRSSNEQQVRRSLLKSKSLSGASSSSTELK